MICYITHRKSPDFLYEPGQNVANSWSSLHRNLELDLKDKIQRWYDEVKDFPAKNVVSFSIEGTDDGATVGHYTQLVWGNTEYVGCGAIYYKDGNTNASSYPFRQTLICNYHPPGNYLGKPVYIIGHAGSACHQANNDNKNGINKNGLCP